MQLPGTLRFDWKDGLLIASGFTALILLQFFWRATFGADLDNDALRALALPAIFAPIAARRAIFGPPQLGNMRGGPFYRLVSIVGLLLIFFGMGAGMITMSRLSRASNPKPDFEAEQRAIYAPNSGLDFSPADESPEVRERRQQADSAELEARIKKDAAEMEKIWLDSDAERKSLNWKFVFATIGLMAIGSFLLSLRYEKLSPNSSTPKPST